MFGVCSELYSPVTGNDVVIPDDFEFRGSLSRCFRKIYDLLAAQPFGRINISVAGLAALAGVSQSTVDRFYVAMKGRLRIIAQYGEDGFNLANVVQLVPRSSFNLVARARALMARRLRQLEAKRKASGSSCQSRRMAWKAQKSGSVISDATNKEVNINLPQKVYECHAMRVPSNWEQPSRHKAPSYLANPVLSKMSWGSSK